MKLLFGTNNPAKLEVMRKRLSSLPIQLLSLNDFPQTPPDVPETGNTPLENARQKAKAYYKTFQIPVFSCDSGLYFENVPDEIQPGVHVRTVNGTYLTDEEMVAYYSGLAKQYGNLTAGYENAICLVMDWEHIYEATYPTPPDNKFLITDKPGKILQKGFPLDSLSIHIKTGKYFNDLPEEKREEIAVEDVFLTFFEQLLQKRQEKQI